MKPNQVQVSYYIFKDLRAQQNGNPDGYDVLRFETLPDAIAEFRSLPSEWTTALGIRISSISELDLVQRREGEPVLCGDYQRIPAYFGNADVQAAVRTLREELGIQWQSDYRIFGTAPLMIPVASDFDFVRDRQWNGKHLHPDDLRYTFSAIQEMHVPGKGWTPTADVFDVARECGYNSPHTEKVTSLHVRYADNKGHITCGDMNPYNFILLQERTKLMERDPKATKALAGDVAEYIGQDVKVVTELIDSKDLAPLVEPVVSAIEGGFATEAERSEARELLGRLLNAPEDGEKKLPLALRMRAGEALNGLYQSRPLLFEEKIEKAPGHEETR